MTKEQILIDALEAVSGERQSQYGKMYTSMKRIAMLWNAWIEMTGVKYLSPHDVAMMMTLFKIARAASGSGHIDSYIDIAGYAACAGEIQGKMNNGKEIQGEGAGYGDGTVHAEDGQRPQGKADKARRRKKDHAA